MYHPFPSRGGGRDQFVWDDDKHLHKSHSMENHLHQVKALSMNISCCERCPKLLNKKLLKLFGVDSVAIDTENNVVYVVGEIDTTTLLNYIAKLGKTAQLLPADKLPRNHVDQKHNHARNEMGKPHKNCCCEDGRHSSQKQQVEEREAHKCEAYVPPSVDPRVCRDFFCKTHPRGRVIVDKVPAESSNFFGMGYQMPFYSGYAPYGGGGTYQHPRWYGEDPRQQFGYSQPQMNLPYHPYGYGYN